MRAEKVQAYRALAGMLLDWATDGVKGVSEVHPRYVAVTERRDGPTPALRDKYSSCADLAHWMLFRLGVRAPWINRAEHRGWKSGVNLNWLTPPPIGPEMQTAAKHPGAPGVLVDTGDVYVVDNVYGGHVICVRDAHDLSIGTAEYGQPGGLQHVHVWSWHGTKLFSGQNPITSLLNLDHVLELEETAGRLAPVDVSCLYGLHPLSELDPLFDAIAAP